MSVRYAKITNFDWPHNFQSIVCRSWRLVYNGLQLQARAELTCTNCWLPINVIKSTEENCNRQVFCECSIFYFTKIILQTKIMNCTCKNSAWLVGAVIRCGKKPKYLPINFQLLIIILGLQVERNFWFFFFLLFSLMKKVTKKSRKGHRLSHELTKPPLPFLALAHF